VEHVARMLENRNAYRTLIEETEGEEIVRIYITYTVGRTPWTGDQHVARSLPTHRTAQT
jgi:hypothetical protein